MELDHALIAVTDLAVAAARLEQRHGLASLAGGRHPGWGTANRIVALGETYLELVAVADAQEAAGSAFGRWVAAERSPHGTPLGWAVRTRELDAVAGRLGLTIRDGSRVTPDGRRLRWRLAGVEEAAAVPTLPFFIEWGRDTPLPGRAAAGDVTLAALELTGDAERLQAWLGGARLPVTVRPGDPALTRIALSNGISLTR